MDNATLKALGKEINKILRANLFSQLAASTTGLYSAIDEILVAVNEYSKMDKKIFNETL